MKCVAVVGGLFGFRGKADAAAPSRVDDELLFRPALYVSHDWIEDVVLSYEVTYKNYPDPTRDDSAQEVAGRCLADRAEAPPPLKSYESYQFYEKDASAAPGVELSRQHNYVTREVRHRGAPAEATDIDKGKFDRDGFCDWKYTYEEMNAGYCRVTGRFLDDFVPKYERPSLVGSKISVRCIYWHRDRGRLVSLVVPEAVINHCDEDGVLQWTSNGVYKLGGVRVLPQN